MQDSGEDQDDDDDGILDALDSCPSGSVGWAPDSQSDFDSDGCQDSGEDQDDDDDGVADDSDYCPKGIMGWYSTTLTDNDGDGCRDSNEDLDDDNDGRSDGLDSCQKTAGDSNIDRDGCPDSDGDGWSDPDESWTVSDGADALPGDPTQWLDSDGDGYGDNAMGAEFDSCGFEAGNSTVDIFGCPDADGDGVSDMGDKFPQDDWRWYDSDDDGIDDLIDDCQSSFGTSVSDRMSCPDADDDGFSNPDPTWTALDGADSFPPTPPSGRTPTLMGMATT